MTRIYALPIELPWNTVDTELLNHVSPQRRERILKYRYPIDRKLSLYAALLTRMLLSIQLKIPSHELAFSKDEHNKPYLLSAPSQHFNFSHTKNMILCSISPQPIGADIERIVTAPLNVMDSVFCRPEIDHVQSAETQTTQNTRFFKIWTSKEAIAKYLGTGLTDEITAINTLDSSHSDFLLSWEEAGYLCSVYSRDAKNALRETCSEKMVQAYFLSPSNAL